MSRILAIEHDRQRQTLLMALIRSHVHAEVTMVDSVQAAIARFEQQQPDVIIAPTLLSPADSEQLMSYVKQHAGPHVQIVTVPALDMLREPSEERTGFGPFRRRAVSLGLQYDPDAVGRQIADRLDSALVLREEQTMLGEVHALVTQETSLALRSLANGAQPGASRVERDRRWAERTPQREISWLSGVRMPWGTDVDLVNISRTGILVESGSKVTPGVTLELHLSGKDLNRIVMARFVRSEIARVDRLGVRYHAAAIFEQPLDIITPRTEPTAAARRATPQSLVGLLNSVFADSSHPEAASIRFARGLRDLVGARDVLIRRHPITPAEDSESIYFQVKEENGSRTILQVMFDRDRELTASEFRLLKAAPGLTAAVLELERAVDDDVQPATRRMSEVA
jgi:CheY-like chemotaxis protein